MGELQRVSVAEESKLGYVKVVQGAAIPSVPVRPKVMLNLLLGLLLGLGFGIGFAFMREAANTSLRRPEDIKEKGYNLLGVIPDMTPEVNRVYDGRQYIEVEGRKLSTRLAPLLNPWSPVTENYRMIRLNLSGREQMPTKRVLVTSAEVGEGKTITAVNLAIAEALSGSRVLLIDADMRKPTAHDVLGMSQSPGLADVLENLPDVSCWETPIDGLYFIPAGVAHTAPSRILDSEHIPQLLEATGHHFDTVILDTPPTQAVTDSVVIGSQTNAEAVVVSASERDVRGLDATMQSLRSADVEVAGVVLNKFKEESLQNGTYEHSYYGDDEYNDDYQAKALKAAEDV